MYLEQLDETYTQLLFAVTEIGIHPDRCKEVPTDKRIILDVTIPLNEIHLITATHRIIMKYKEENTK